MNITLVLDNIRSTNNVGSILRTADAFGVHEVIMIGITPYPKLDNDNRLPHIARRNHNQISKTALGAENYIQIKYFETIDQVVSNIPENSKIICLEQNEKSVPLNQLDSNLKNVFLIVGNEVKGVNKKFLDLSDQIIEIPMRGKKESLNVSVATGIALYHLTN